MRQGATPKDFNPELISVSKLPRRNGLGDWIHRWAKKMPVTSSHLKEGHLR